MEGSTARVTGAGLMVFAAASGPEMSGYGKKSPAYFSHLFRKSESRTWSTVAGLFTT